MNHIPSTRIPVVAIRDENPIFRGNERERKRRKIHSFVSYHRGKNNDTLKYVREYYARLHFCIQNL